MNIKNMALTVYVSNIQTTWDFYVLKLEVGCLYYSKNDRVFAIRAGDSTVTFKEYGEYESTKWHEFGQKGIGILLCFEVDEYDDFKKRVIATGGNILFQYENDSGFRFSDLDGYIIEISRAPM